MHRSRHLCSVRTTVPLPRSRALLHRSGGHGRFATCFGRFAAGGEGVEGDLAVSAIDVTHGGSIALRCLLECARTFRFPDSGAVVLVTGQDLDGVQERNSYETQERCRLRRWDEIASRFPVSGSVFPPPPWPREPSTFRAPLSDDAFAAGAENDTTCHRFPLSSFRRPSSRGVEKMEEHFRFPPSADPPRGAQRNGGARRFAFRRPLFRDHFPAERCETVV